MIFPVLYDELACRALSPQVAGEPLCRAPSRAPDSLAPLGASLLISKLGRGAPWAAGDPSARRPGRRVWLGANDENDDDQLGAAPAPSAAYMERVRLCMQTAAGGRASDANAAPSLLRSIAAQRGRRIPYRLAISTCCSSSNLSSDLGRQPGGSGMNSAQARQLTRPKQWGRRVEGGEIYIYIRAA